VFERQSVLAGVHDEGRQGAVLGGARGEQRYGRAVSTGGHDEGPRGGTRIGESRGWTLVQAAAFASTHAEFRQVMRSQLGADLPTRVGDVIRVNGRQLLKTGAEQYWIVTREEDGAVGTGVAGTGTTAAYPGVAGTGTTATHPGISHPAIPHLVIPPQMGAVTDLSHSRTCMFIEGVCAAPVLAKGVPLDFHPDYFRVDQFALTGLHHMPVLIHRSAEYRYELYALRTYALSVWEWLAD